MTGQDKYNYWMILSEYDIETAKTLLENDRYNYVPVLCQQAIERLVKGMHVYHLGKESPKSHNIPFILKKILDDENFLATQEGKKFIKEKEDYEDFLIDIMYYYTNDYPFSYKKVMNRFIKRDLAENLYNKSVILINWLKTFQES